jgi:hypothetical protein
LLQPKLNAATTPAARVILCAWVVLVQIHAKFFLMFVVKRRFPVASASPETIVLFVHALLENP